MAGSITWRTTPRQAWSPGAAQYQKAVLNAIYQQMQFWAATVENQAKEDAPWTDRTGNARQGLKGDVNMDDEIVQLVLKHNVVEYGLSLEIDYGGRYAIILPTLESNYDGIFKSVVELLK